MGHSSGLCRDFVLVSYCVARTLPNPTKELSGVARKALESWINPSGKTLLGLDTETRAADADCVGDVTFCQVAVVFFDHSGVDVPEVSGDHH
jgi:hypothetical protein